MARPTHRRCIRHRRGRLVVPAALALVLATLGLTQAPPASALNSAEQTYVNEINGLRASLGLQPLIVDPNLTSIAHQHDLDMAAAGRLYHSPNLTTGVTSPWRQLAENIGMRQQFGPDLWQAFLQSPSHYANIVNPAFTHIGIGDDVVNGNEWTTQRFMQIGSTTPPAAATTYHAPQTVVRQAVAPATTSARPTSTTARPATTTTPSTASSSSSIATSDSAPPPDDPPPQADADHVAAVVAVLQVVRA